MKWLLTLVVVLVSGGVFAQDACQVKSIQKLSTQYEALGKSPTSNTWIVSQFDSNDISQIYTTKAIGGKLTCITCADRAGAPHVDRNKFMPSWHPSGKWLFVAVEEDNYDWNWLPQKLKRGFLASGVWLNMWVTTPTGSRWWQLTNFNNSVDSRGGFVGTTFTPDGKTVAWAELLNGASESTIFGTWRLYLADFSASPDNGLWLSGKRDITPAGARWLEPAPFSPDGRTIPLSTDIGLSDAQGQDQWSLDVFSGALKQLTATPTVWDEHGVFSASGNKIVFMSSYPYRDDPNASKVLGLKTEFMLMDADGSNIRQLTHFNVPGYPESQSGNTVAAVAGFIGNGSQMFAATMGPDFTAVDWLLTFAGRCGSL